MAKIAFPAFEFRIKTENDKELIFDELRKQWMKLTPEEWVRQNFIQYLIQTKNYPAALIGIEKEIKLGELKKRFDLLIYNSSHEPWMMIECKAMNVELSENVLQQLLRYHITVPTQYLAITNGSFTYCYRKLNNSLTAIDELPEFGK